MRRNLCGRRWRRATRLIGAALVVFQCAGPLWAETADAPKDINVALYTARTAFLVTDETISAILEIENRSGLPVSVPSLMQSAMVLCGDAAVRLSPWMMWDEPRFALEPGEKFPYQADLRKICGITTAGNYRIAWEAGGQRSNTVSMQVRPPDPRTH